ncbi:MAG: hypothetical protein U7126_13735 [Microcoleus sp.]
MLETPISDVLEAMTNYSTLHLVESMRNQERSRFGKEKGDRSLGKEAWGSGEYWALHLSGNF